MNMDYIRYTRRKLFEIKSSSRYPSSDVISRLKHFKLFHGRGCRRGSHAPRSIKTLKPGKSNNPRPTTVKTYKHFEVSRKWYSLPTFLLSNVTSLNNKMDELTTVINSTCPDIVAITEAWQFVPETSQIPNYLLFHSLRKTRRGGGVVLYCHQTFRPSPLNVDVPDGVEALWVRLTPPHHPRHAASILCCVVYHPPRAPTKDLLLHHLIHTSDHLRVAFPSARLVICGDFNQLDTTSLQNELHLVQVVDFPTYENNTLDLILTDLAEHYSPPQSMAPFGRSRHLSVCWSPRSTVTQTQPCSIREYRPLRDSSIRQFGQWLTRYPWVEVLTVEDVNEKWNNYLSSITTAYHHHFPIQTLRTHPADLPWITDRIKRLIQQRDQAFRANNTALFKSLRNKTIREIKMAKKNYYPNKLRNLKDTNISKWYGKVKELCGLNKQSSSLPCTSHLSITDAANEVNTHFASICQRLPRLDPTVLPAYLPAPSTTPLVQRQQVYLKLTKYQSKRSTSPIDLPMTLVKEFAYELSLPLCSITNASLQQNKCPSDWKTSYVTAIPKTSNPGTFNDLRPISITPLPSLLCESFVSDWAYADLAPTVDIQQFGNMRSSSTTHCLISFLDFIYKNIEKRKTSVVTTFIDFAKAFDLVDHTTIISKAATSSIRTSLIPWLADFLSDRRQAVRLQGSVSTFLPITCGVPQGTRMGPLCFLVLINDALMDTPFRWKYVDDSSVGAVIDNTAPDYSNLQHTLNHLLNWTTNNHVTINNRKSVVMHFNVTTTPLPAPTLTLDTHSLEVVRSTKLLGVVIDDKLTWDEHVTTITKSASYRLYMLRRLKSLGLPTAELCSIYKSFILPRLTYASPAWSCSLSITQKRRLERIQKRAIKIILGPSYTNYDDALLTLQLSTLADLHQQALAQFGQKLLVNPRHRHLLPPDAPLPRRAVRAYNKLVPIRARTERYKNSPIPTLVSMINSH